VTIAVVLGVAGCGDGPDAPTPTAPSDLGSRLVRAGAEPLPGGGYRLTPDCEIAVVLTTAEARAYEGDPWFVPAPGGGGVKILPRAGAEATCRSAVAAALGAGG